jgi:hypothetical protein
VPGVGEAQPHARRDLADLAVGQRHHPPTQRLDLLEAVQRRGHRAAATAGGPGGLRQLQVRAVAQHRRDQFDRRWRRMDLAAVAARHQPGQQAAVVEVRVAQDDGVERVRPESPRLAVARRGIAAALHEAAVDQHAAATVLDEVMGAGDLAGRPEERQTRHHRFLLGTVMAPPGPH